jgi:hypothetical protein
MNADTSVALDASTATLAARMLAQRRWGDTRVRNLVHELTERRDEIGAEQLDELRELVDDVSTEEG